jgi:hypothetical protein
MLKKVFDPKMITILGIIIIAALLRFVPNRYNITPIIAIALFGGAYFANKKIAFIIPIITMLITDLFLGFHSTLFVVYGCFAISVLIGIFYLKTINIGRIITASLLSSIIFYLVTNFAVWMLSGMYENSFAGLIFCYERAIPFFRNSLIGDLTYSGVLFGGFAFLEKYVPVLKPIQEQ